MACQPMRMCHDGLTFERHVLNDPVKYHVSQSRDRKVGACRPQMLIENSMRLFSNKL